MKRKLLLLILTLLIVPFVNVKAGPTGETNIGSATASIDESITTDISFMNWSASTSSGIYQPTKYADSRTNVNFNGVDYTAYCIDPYLKTPTGTLTCNPINYNPAVEQIAIWSKIYDHTTFQLAYRMLALMQGMTIRNKDFTDAKEAIVRYAKIKNGDEKTIEDSRKVLESMGQCQNPEDCDTPEKLASKFLYGDQETIDKAISLASRMAGLGSFKYETSDERQGKLYFSIKSESGHNVRVWVYANAKFEHEVDFVCKDCEIVSNSFNGTSGYLDIIVDENECAYTIEAYYPTEGPYECTSNSKDTQTLIIYVEETTTTAAQTFTSALSEENCAGANCCSESPIEPGFITGKVNNCCTESHSEVSEYDLDQLFCFDKELKVEYYDEKCSIDHYIDKNAALNDYCTMYCTERVTVDIPEPVTAISGRYFMMKKNPVGNTTSAYVEGYKRCRIRIEYDAWEKDYGQQVDTQIEYYNEIQRLRAVEKLYNNLELKERVNGSLIAEASCSCTEDLGEDPKTGEKRTKTHSATAQSDTFRYNYNVYVFPQTKQIYYTTKVNSGPRERYEEYEILPDAKLEEIHEKYSINNFGQIIANADGKKAMAERACRQQLTSCDSSISVDSNRPKLPYEDEDWRDENVSVVKSEIRTKIKSEGDGYNAASDQAKKLEEEIDVCNEYFVKYQGSNAEASYQFNAKQSFAYSQVYLDEYGNLQQDTLTVDWLNSPGCRVTGPFTGNDQDVREPKYSEVYSKYSKEIQKVKDMKNTPIGDIQLQGSKHGFEQFLDEEYEVKKQFTHDAKYRVVCEWEEDTNQLFTLVPNGYSSENTSVINKTFHNRQYRIYLSTLDGTYETFWDITGLGEEGKFDNFFRENGTTCAGERSLDASMFTCKLHVEYEIVLTGYCNGSNGTDTNNNPEDCLPHEEMYNLFTFKIVDPSNLFPTNPIEESEEIYAYNWLIDEKGQEVLGIIQEDGEKDLTYSIDNLTYSFNLTPSDMKHIKNYNESREFAGGYSDFTLVCDCPTTINPTDGCKQCKSTFLTNISNGILEYNKVTYEMSGWANSRDTLTKVREKNHW